jgi:D-inositol-3-phosphate glycosyltransferase
MMALDAVETSGIQDLDLVFIGSEMNDYGLLVRKRAESMCRTGRLGSIQVLNGVSKAALRAAYRAADVSLCTSKWESGPMIVLESMAAGTPFISTDVGFVRTLAGGLIAKDARDMGDKLRQLLQNPGLAQELGRAGRRACEQTYNWPRIISRYDALLNEVVAGV